jgi:hypothetical protein
MQVLGYLLLLTPFLILFLALLIINNQITMISLAQIEGFLHFQEKMLKNTNLHIFAQILDCPKDSDEFITVIQQNLKGLDEYLGFFEESIAIGIPNSLTKVQAEILFSKHEELIKRHNFVRSHINNKNYKNLQIMLQKDFKPVLN